MADKARKNITAEQKINGIREGTAVTVADQTFLLFFPTSVVQYCPENSNLRLEGRSGLMQRFPTKLRLENKP